MWDKAFCGTQVLPLESCDAVGIPGHAAYHVAEDSCKLKQGDGPPINIVAKRPPEGQVAPHPYAVLFFTTLNKQTSVAFLVG